MTLFDLLILVGRSRRVDEVSPMRLLVKEFQDASMTRDGFACTADGVDRGVLWNCVFKDGNCFEIEVSKAKKSLKKGSASLN